MAKPKTIEISETTFATVCKGESITLHGKRPTKKTADEITGKNAAELQYLAARQELADSKSTAGFHILADLYDGTGKDETIRSLTKSLERNINHGNDKDVTSYADAIGRHVASHTQHFTENYSNTFKIGDVAEYDSYNLSYTAEIVSITEKTVTFDNRGKRRRIKLHEFDWRNWDFDAAKTAEQNAITRMSI